MPISGGTQNTKSNGNITSGSMGPGLSRDGTTNGANMNIPRNLNQQSGGNLHNNISNSNQIVNSSLSPHQRNSKYHP